MSPRIEQTRRKAAEKSGRAGTGSAGDGSAAVSSGEALGLLELTSIAKGVEATDLMMKAANVELMASRSICAGKYLVMVRGDVAACSSSVKAGMECGRETVADSFVIPNLHPEIFPAIAQSSVIDEVSALGIIEAFDVASLIEGADAAVKAASVHLLEIRLAMALGGKAFCVLTGDVSAVRAAVEAGSAIIAAKGLLTDGVVIPSPDAALVRELLGGRLA